MHVNFIINEHQFIQSSKTTQYISFFQLEREQLEQERRDRESAMSALVASRCKAINILLFIVVVQKKGRNIREYQSQMNQIRKDCTIH